MDERTFVLSLIDEWEAGKLDLEGSCTLFALLSEMNMLRYLPARFRRYAELLAFAGLIEGEAG